MIIRPETPSDFAAVAEVNVRAFGGRLEEAVIVALLRQRRAYTPDLSLVAEVDGEVVGHALFTPVQMPLMGDTVRAVVLAPLAVDPAAQRRGIGSALMAAGHAAARQQGAVLSFLLGHPDYYPRFGYRMQAFGWSRMTVQAAPQPLEGPWVARVPVEADLPALMALWAHEEGGVDFSMQPEATLTDWLSPNPFVRCVVYERDGQVAGYTRVLDSKPADVRVLLAADAEAARTILQHLAHLAGADSLTLSLHPASASAGALGQATVETADPFMACPLVPGALDDGQEAVQSSKRLLGRPLWPTVFDLALV